MVGFDYICVQNKFCPMAPSKGKDNNFRDRDREWYVDWFDSPYYHLLYRHRDEREAKQFIDSLLELIQPRSGARILDLACGKGRYSRYLAEKGYEVTGLDLSVSSIQQARRYEHDRLSFFTHDMRQPFRTNYFDYVFNFFTSFGYFESEKDDIKTLKNVAQGLVPGGSFVLDFFNAHYVINQLTGRETKVIDGIRFEIEKRVEGHHIVKTIEFEDDGHSHYYKERVRLFDLADFHRLFNQAGLKIERIFGDYQLHKYDREKSPRLILLANNDE